MAEDLKPKVPSGMTPAAVAGIAPARGKSVV